MLQNLAGSYRTIEARTKIFSCRVISAAFILLQHLFYFIARQTTALDPALT